ncbi:FABP family protein [Pseudonocardia acidicola]|uniref:Peroxynitrite isomerase n=1 Tax=Pseudonocardia acidicola TaxID=2724939 RepID=A0ABX1SAR0_9PSEU|nr:FABP family protein [Pseudonocardia acidicola]NMH98646.1 FABP family protein [Pseudonocardia acidicola]
MSGPDHGGEPTPHGTVTGPTNAAPDSPRRNRPRWDDLPIPDDTANLREGPELHEDLLGLLPLVGVWRGTGVVDYPTIDGPYEFGQQIVFAHDGRPFLSYESRAWLLGPDGEVLRPAARETGFWRPQPGGELEVLITHATGIVDVFYGRARNLTSWEIETDAVVRTASAKEVTRSKRLYGLVEGGDLAYADDREMMGQPLQPHMSARLQRIAG